MELAIAGHRVVVRKNNRHPEDYLWIDVDDSQFFLGTLQKGMTRGDVRELALRWLREHPNALHAELPTTKQRGVSSIKSL